MSAVLRVCGRDFDVDRYCAQGALAPCAVYRRGEPVYPASQPHGRRNEQSGVHIAVSDAAFEEFPRQVEEAVVFLRTHYEEVRQLVQFPGVELAYLDFGVARREVEVQCDYLPPELVRLAGELGLGIELSQYPALLSSERRSENGASADWGGDSGDVPVDDPHDPKSFRTLKGFLTGEEVDEANYFCFSATLRIHGDDIPFEEISQRLGVQPTVVHRKGDRRGPRSPAYRDDAWHFQPSLPETEPLEQHIEALWQIMRSQLDYLKALKQRFKVDVFCGYRSNCDYAGFEVSHRCLELFTALEVPFGVSVIVA